MATLAHDSTCRDTCVTAVLLGLHIVNEAKNQLKSLLSDLNISMNQWLVLKIVFLKYADTPTKIANFMNTDTPAITRYVNTLVQYNYIKREHHADDRRVIELKLTTKGSHVVENICKRYEGILDDLERHLTQDELTMWETVKNSANSN